MTPDDTQSLRRGMRDLVALSTLPAIWTRADPIGIADSLAEVLLRMLSADFVYVRAPGRPSAPVEAVRTQKRAELRAESADKAKKIGEALAPWLKIEGLGAPESIPHPFENGAARLVVLPIGHEQDCGWLAAGSRRTNFPTEIDRLLLGVGVNQVAIALQRTKTEQSLRQSESRYRALLEAGSQLVWNWNPETLEGDYAAVRQWWEEMTGQPPDKQAGRGWLEMVHPEDRERVSAEWTAAMTGASKFEAEYRVSTRAGAFRHILSRTVPIRDESGAVREWVGMMIEVTEQRRQQEALKEADRRKDEFLAMLAHELRNPLAPIRNGLQLILLANGDETTVNEARAMMERQVSQLVRLTDDLLDVARITRGKIEIRRERVTLAAVVNSAVEASRPLIGKRGHELTLTLPPEPIELEADPTRLAQTLMNLLNNAAKYTDPGGRIWLTAQREGGQVSVRVKDTGIGIPREMLSPIFEMFTQVDRSLERSQGGLGMGLTLVKNLVEMHGGSVEARSEGPGQGSEFVVRLPVAAGRVEGKRSDPDAKQVLSRSGYRILVVDDHEDSAKSMGMILEKMGNALRTASDGAQAIEVAEAFRPNVIFLDIGMPRLNGYDAARRIREAPWGRDIILVALTGWGQEEDKRRSQAAGFNYHMTKPVEPAALKKWVASLTWPEQNPRFAPHGSDAASF